MYFKPASRNYSDDLTFVQSRSFKSVYMLQIFEEHVLSNLEKFIPQPTTSQGQPSTLQGWENSQKMKARKATIPC